MSEKSYREGQVPSLTETLKGSPLRHREILGKTRKVNFLEARAKKQSALPEY